MQSRNSSISKNQDLNIVGPFCGFFSINCCKFTILIILMKLSLNSKLDLIRTVKFVKQQFKTQTGRKVLLWNQVKSRMEACYSELVLLRYVFLIFRYFVAQGSFLINLIHKISNFRVFMHF